MAPASRARPRRRALFTFRSGYAGLALLVFATEAAIALWVRDRIVRPYAGDSLAVVLVYLVLRASTRLSVGAATAAALAIACAIEGAQRFHFVRLLGLDAYPVARVVLGTGYDPHDFLAYGAGGILILLVETLRARRPARNATS
ncbi:DUF2809 domain-containing protein [Sphingomonas sp. ac-8]|uniref:DUF2809 domain-containing protein n=1 Tax=Sphingomonas sp. ac-8 TaxID=3242977 RepID=UPI003A812B05